MRGLLGFLIFLVIIFFVIGEWQGWYLGVAGQVPMLLYKKDTITLATRRTLSTDSLPFTLSGKVRNGTVKIEGYYQQSGSFQTGAKAGNERAIFEAEFSKGQEINLNETLDNGRGNYTIRLIFQNATGVFNLKLPSGSQL